MDRLRLLGLRIINQGGESQMKKALFILIFALVASMSLSALSVQREQNVSGGPNVLAYIVDPNSIVYGRTFSEWDAEWQQWAYSIPVAKHPLFDNGNCSEGQSGMVWFLGGKFCRSTDPNCGHYTNVQRNCTVPRGKYLYLPVDNAEDSALEEDVVEHPGDINYQQIGKMRQGWDPWAVAAPTEHAIIDGVLVPHLQRYAVQSTVFSFTIPDDNYLNALYGVDSFKAGYYYLAVDDGRYLMLAPLPPGNHTIRVGAEWGGWGFDVTYFITVLK